MTTAEAGTTSAPPRQLVLVLFLGVFMAALDTAIVGPALPAMQATFGVGVGIAVGGALRTLAIDAAPVQLRGTAQGLVNMATSIGVLLAAAVIATIAEVRGGFADAYVFVAVLLTIALVATRSLQPMIIDTPVRV